MPQKGRPPDQHAGHLRHLPAGRQVKLFWEKTLHRLWPHELELVRANPQFKLPVVLSGPEVRRILSAVPALDHRVCLIT